MGFRSFKEMICGVGLQDMQDMKDMKDMKDMVSAMAAGSVTLRYRKNDKINAKG
jgi:hypothetical protein